MADANESPSTDGTFVVMHTAVANFVRGCRVTLSDLFHDKLPGREQHMQRLIAIGALKPESDPEAAAVPETHPIVGAAPIIVAGAENNLTPTVTLRNQLLGIRDPRDYPGAKADSTSLDIHADDPPETKPAARSRAAKAEASEPDAAPQALPPATNPPA